MAGRRLNSGNVEMNYDELWQLPVLFRPVADNMVPMDGLYLGC
jgi:hypothetical protein